MPDRPLSPQSSVLSTSGGGTLFLVGLGPGGTEHLTERARVAISSSDAVVGYGLYLEQIADLIRGKEVFTSAMTREQERARRAIDLACSGRVVAVVSSGDSGIYGLAGLVYELLLADGWQPGQSPVVEVVPGVTALVAAAALLGAPLMHDFASISLSDLLTPWEVIVARLEAAARADFVVVLYNPASSRRTEGIVAARETLLRHRPGSTPVGIVRNAFRPGQSVIVADLATMLDHPIDMLTTVIVGNASTRAVSDLLVTPRGYRVAGADETGCRKGERRKARGEGDALNEGSQSRTEPRP